MEYFDWKTIAAAPACRAVRAGAEVWPLPSGGFFSGGRVYTHGLRTKRGTCYAVCREVMREVNATQLEMRAEQSANSDFRRCRRSASGRNGRPGRPIEALLAAQAAEPAKN